MDKYIPKPRAAHNGMVCYHNDSILLSILLPKVCRSIRFYFGPVPVMLGRPQYQGEFFFNFIGFKRTMEIEMSVCEGYICWESSWTKN